MAKEKTFAEVVEGLELSAEQKNALLEAKQKEDESLASALKKAYDDSTKELQSKIQELSVRPETDNDLVAALKAEIETLKKDASIKDRQTPGTFKSKSKREYKFVDGVLEFNFKGNIISTIDALEDKVLMEELIDLGAGILQEVQ